MPKNYYEILGVNQDAPPAEIRKKYIELALQWHPDKNPNKKEEAEQKFKEIGKAYVVLSDERERILYNNSLANDESWKFKPNSDFICVPTRAMQFLSR